MKNKILGIFVCMLLITSTLTFYGIETVKAEDPPIGNGFVVGNGTYFEITNSSYLNVSLTSSENVYLILSSMPYFVDYYIESNCSANFSDITLSGFEASKTYYMYEDGNLTGDFVTDENGSYSYTQDLKTTHSVNIRENNFEFQGPEDEGCSVLGNGTFFEVTNSSYLNVTLTSSENVHVYLYSRINIVSYHIESNCSATFTNLTLTGFIPNSTYYMYQNGVLLNSFIADEYGQYSYTQDITIHNHLVIQEDVSTIEIRSDGSVWPSTAPINRVGNVYYVTQNISNDHINILCSNIILDGQGFHLFYNSWYAIYASNVQNVVIRNFNYIRNTWGYGIFISNSQYVNIENCYFKWSIYISINIEYCNYVTINNVSIYRSRWHAGLVLTGGNHITINNSTFIENYYGGLTNHQMHDFKIFNSLFKNNDLANPTRYWGIALDNVRGSPQITGCNISDHGECGIAVTGGSEAIITNNSIDNNGIGIQIYAQFSGGNPCIVARNNISNNDIGVWQTYAENDVFYHNTFWQNNLQYGGGMWMWGYYRQPNNIWDNGAGEGNYWSDYTGVDDGNNGRVVGDGIGDTLIRHPYTDITDVYYLWYVLRNYYRLDNYPLMTPWSANDPPVAHADGPYSINEGDSLTLDASGSTDSDGDPLTYSWDLDSDAVYGDVTGLTPTIDWNTLVSYGLDDDGTYTIGLEVDDSQETDITTTTVTVNNVAPTADAGEDKTGNEPSTFIFTGSHTDPGTMDTHTYEWDFDYDSVTFDVDGTGTSVTNSWEDDFDGTVALRVTDDDGGWSIDTCLVTVNNVHPTITSFAGPLDPVNINNPVEIDGAFTDPGTLDTHTATIDWDDGNITSATVVETDGSGTINDSHYFGQPGVYTIKLNVTDDDGDSDEITLSYYVVVYDPSAGFVTGGGWINSPEGAYTPNPNLTGKANFGFVSKYKKGQQNPTGNTEFQFHAADMNFHSDNYDWLVIANHKAMYKGTGTINGIGNYGFMLSAIDEELTNSTEIDLFRIKIWDIDNDDEVIYDNMLGEDEDEEPTTEIGGGNIKIHSGN